MSLSIEDILRIASSRYPDNEVLFQFNSKTERLFPIEEVTGDLLARFIAQELLETFEDSLSDEEKLNSANIYLTDAARELLDCAEALKEKAEKLNKEKAQQLAQQKAMDDVAELKQEVRSLLSLCRDPKARKHLVEFNGELLDSLEAKVSQ